MAWPENWTPKYLRNLAADYRREADIHRKRCQEYMALAQRQDESAAELEAEADKRESLATSLER